MPDVHQDLDISTSIEEFLQDCKAKGFAKKTFITYQSNLRPWQHFLANHGISTLPDVTADIVLKYRHYLQAQYRGKTGNPISTSTQSSNLRTVNYYLTYCQQLGKILLNPAYHITLPKRIKPLPRGILSKQQIKKLLCLPDTKTPKGFRDRVILELFYATGMRRMELISLCVSDCDLAERRIFIRNGKGGKQRWVPIGKKVCKILGLYIGHSRPMLIKQQQHDALIVGNKGGPIGGRHLYSLISRYFKQLTVKTDCHGLRHTCATHLLRGKANIRVIQCLLGHASLGTTQIYTRVDIDDMARAINKAHPREKMQCDEL